MRRVFQFFCISIALLEASGSAFAKNTGTPASPSPVQANPVLTDPTLRTNDLSWSLETVSQPCDQACLLGHGGESLSLHALQIVEHMDALQNEYIDAVKKELNSQDKTGYEAIVRSLSTYCSANTPALGAERSDAQGCLRNFLGVQRLKLQELKSAIVQTQMSELSYRSNASGAFQAQGAPPQAMVPQYAVAPSSRDIQKQYDDDVKLIGSDRYAQWQASLPPPPNKQNYCKTVMQPDPLRKGETIPYVQRNGSKCVVDTERYQADLMEYNRLAGKTGISKQPSNEFQREAKDNARISQTEDMAAYRKARNQFTQKANEQVTGGPSVTGVNQLTFSKASSNGPAPASVGGKDVTALIPGKTTNRSSFTVRFHAEDIDSAIGDFNDKNLDKFFNDVEAQVKELQRQESH